MAYTVVLHKNPGYPNFGIYIGEDVPSGLYVVTTEPNSPAAQENIRPGDRVLAFNGQLVSSLSTNARDILARTAATAQTLTLSLEPTDALNGINIRPNSAAVYKKFYPNSSQTTNYINKDLERYV